MLSVIDCMALMPEGFFVVMWLEISVVYVICSGGWREVPVLVFFVVGFGTY